MPGRGYLSSNPFAKPTTTQYSIVCMQPELIDGGVRNRFPSAVEVTSTESILQRTVEVHFSNLTSQLDVLGRLFRAKTQAVFPKYRNFKLNT